MSIFDCEYGELFYNYGILGTLIYIIFFINVFCKLQKRKRLIFIFFLWIVSSTIIFSYRTSFLTMLMLSKYYTYSLKTI